MKKCWFILFAVYVSIIALSCDKKAEIPDLPPLTKDEISGERLWERLTVETDYKDYPAWPDYEGLQLGQAPHGRRHRIFINPVLRDSLPIPEKVAPIGTIVIKENYSADEMLEAYTVMAKVDGYDPDNKDWFWAKYDAEGNVLVEGKLKPCADCHAGSANDCLIVWQLDWPVEDED